MIELSRRDLVLNSTAAFAAFGLGQSVALIGAADAQQPLQAFSWHKIGDLEVISLMDGMIEVPPREGFIANANVDQTKAALRAGGLSDAVVPIPFTVLAVKMGARLVLVDAGTGGFPIYGPRSGWLLRSMTAAGLDPKDVRAILISHLHGDHIYGLIDKETQAQTFPDAEIIVPAEELKWWTRPEVLAMDLGPTRKGLAQRILTTLATWKNVRPVEGEQELLPGVRAVFAHGHSPGQVAHLFSAGDKQLLATADVSWLPALFVRNPDWRVSLDQDAAMAVDTRKRIFDRAIAHKLVVTGTHWPLPNVGTIAKDGGGYAFVPATT